MHTLSVSLPKRPAFTVHGRSKSCKASGLRVRLRSSTSPFHTEMRSDSASRPFRYFPAVVNQGSRYKRLVACCACITNGRHH